MTGTVYFANGTVYYIDNAGCAKFNSLDTAGATSLGSTLDVTGATTLSSTLAVTGAATLNSTLTVKGTATMYHVIPADDNTTYELGSETARWKKLHIGTADTYGSATQPIWWSDGKPATCTSYANAAVKTAGTFTSAKSVTLTGDATGTASSKAGWSVPTTVWKMTPHEHDATYVAAVTVPTDYDGKLIFTGMKTNATIGITSELTYSYVIGLRGYSSKDGGGSHEFAFNDNAIYHRMSSTGADTWGSWNMLVRSAAGNAVGSATQPVWINSAGIITACTSYANASVNYANSAGAVAWANVSDKPATATRWPKWSEVTDKTTFSGGTTTLAWGQTHTIATVDGNAVKITMPANPNTDHYAWSDITGKPSTFTPAAHDHSNLVTIGDKRSTATTPNDYNNKIIFAGLKNSSTVGSPSSDSYSYVVGLRGWADSSGGNSHEFAFNNTGIYWRTGGTTSWNSWNRLVTNSGTWSISITGSSASCTGNAATATALTSNAGGGEQPIYFTGGKPSATSYALKATVNNGDANYVAYYSGARAISSSKAATAMIMPAHYYHNLYNNNPTTGTTVYVHYYNSSTTSTNTFANLRVKSGSTYKTLAFGGDGSFTWNGTSVVTNSGTWSINITGSCSNSDTVDSLHASSFARSFVSQSYTFNTLASTYPSALGMVYTGTGVPSGSTAWWHYLQMTYNNGEGGGGSGGNYWVTQLANRPGATNDFFIRSRAGGDDAAGSWSAWARILTTTNYTSYCATTSHTHDYMPTSWRRENVIACYKGVDQNCGTAGYWGAMTTQSGVTGNWWHVLSMDWSGNDINNWISQLALPTENRTGVYYRSQNGTAITSVGWKKLWTQGESITSAVWNDYAEYRESDCNEFGYVLMEKGDGALTKTTERLSHFAGISSDTWGFAQGETDQAKMPLAVAGRVLCYPYKDRNQYHPGDPLCAAPGGTVDIMTREEVALYPDRIVGTVSCVPDYDEWGGSNLTIEDRPPVKVNGRIWIKVR